MNDRMNLKRRIAKEWIWLVCTIAGCFLLWSGLGFYKPPHIDVDFQPLIENAGKVKGYPISPPGVEVPIEGTKRTMTISQIRAGFPQYNDLSNKEIASKLYHKHYQDKMSFKDFADQIGYDIETDEEPVRRLTAKRWNELRIIFAVLLVPFLYFMRVTVWSFKQIRQKLE